MARNQFKTETTESKSSKKEKTSKKKKKIGSPKFLKPLENFKTFLANEKTQQISGLVFILFSAYLLIAFTSFLFTWKVDQSKVELPFGEYFFNAEIIVDNWLGKIGASIAHLFINEWFGIASFLFVGLFFLYGFRILFKISLVPLLQTSKISLFFLIWFSLFFGYFFKDNLYFLGGAVGYEMNKYLASILGNAGSGILIFFILLIFLVSNFNLSSYLQLLLKADKEANAEENAENSQDEAVNIINPLEGTEAIVDQAEEAAQTIAEEELESKITEDLNLEVESEGILTDEKTQEEEQKAEEEVPEQSVELSTELTEEINVVPEGDVEIEIEEVKEETTLSDKEVNKKLEDYGEYDPKLDLSDYKIPGIDLLVDHGDGQIKVDKEELERS